MINLNDEKYAVNNVKIFNNGVAGIAKGCTINVVKKQPADADNAPLYKLVITDSAGAEINKGYVFANFDQSSQGALDFLVKECKHLIGLVDGKQLDQVESYRQLVDYTMKSVKEGAAGKKFNTVVSYGTKERPKRFLEIASAFSIVKDGEAPWWNPKFLAERPEPTENPGAPTGGAPAAGSEDGGW